MHSCLFETEFIGSDCG